MAITTSLMVVPVALPMARSRSMGQSSAAKRRAPVMLWLKMVRGAWKETAEVSLRTPLLRVRTSAAGIAAASAVSASALRSAATGICGSDGASTPRPDRLRGGPAAHGAGMPRRSGSVVSTLCSSRIAETPSTSAWWVLV